MHPSIPWYQSPVYAGALVSLITQLLVLFGVADKVAPDTVSGAVNAVLQLVAIAAAGLAWWKRQRSSIQPIALTKSSAEVKDAKRMPYGVIGALLAAVLVLPLLPGCVTTPQSVVSTACQEQASYQVERCAKAIGELYAVYQQRGLEAVQAPATPDEVRAAIKTADAAATPVVRELLASLKVYLAVKADLAAGSTTEDQVAIANEQLQQWVQLALPRVTALINAFGGRS